MNPEAFQDDVYQWWRSLQGNRAESAAIRRCHSLTDVMLTRPFQSLRAMGLDTGMEPLATIAWVLGGVREDRGAVSMGQHLAQHLSDLRFRRLVEHTEREALARHLIRAIHQTERAAPVRTLSTDLRFWGDAVRRRWTFDFYDNFKDN